MGTIFGPGGHANPKNINEKLEAIIAYEEAYMKLIRSYKNEIAEIQNMMCQLRQEREEFYNSKLPEIEKRIKEDEVLSNEAKEKWLTELHDNVEKSFTISEKLISHYVTSNLEEFKSKMQSILNKV
ncbi:hypothetical protein [Ruminococcus flavefaciens]|uniref:hypothetical protein n=1 Tax=Ruminococcus flavefaciens TaxID=1265 RepID=UPI0026F0B759|nr:hypothetical protein [Ruminococcus flavefaciens]